MTSHTGPVEPVSEIRAEFPISRPVPVIVRRLSPAMGPKTGLTLVTEGRTIEC